MTASDGAPRQAAGGFSAPGSARRWMQGFLAIQIFLAAALVWIDVSGLGFGEERVGVSREAPATPGDQRRRWDPRTIPTRPDAPREGGLIDLPSDLGALEFRFLDREGYGRIMVLEGGVAPGDAARFEAALAEAAESAAGPPAFVALHSPGGSLADALEIGRAIREAGLNTLVVADGACLSACPTILFGGVERHVSAKAWIGMHQSFLADVSVVTTRRALEEVQTMQGEVIAFARDMGVDPAVHVHALTTPPDEIYYLLPEEMETYRVATTLFDGD